MSDMEKTCPYCGKTYRAKRSRQVYCSAECSDKDRPARKKRQYLAFKSGMKEIEKVCAVCGKTFTTTHASQICCSKECAYKRNKMLAGMNKAGIKTRKSKLRDWTLKPSRVCHDCGKPTSNYRCIECWVKWRTKHGVPVSEVCA